MDLEPSDTRYIVYHFLKIILWYIYLFTKVIIHWSHYLFVFIIIIIIIIIIFTAIWVFLIPSLSYQNPASRITEKHKIWTREILFFRVSWLKFCCMSLTLPISISKLCFPNFIINVHSKSVIFYMLRPWFNNFADISGSFIGFNNNSRITSIKNKKEKE